MGGKEGTRGYLYQAFAAILEALTEEYWNNIIVEFKSHNDKVDIALDLDNKIIKTIQVKSSINLFTKNNVLKWLEELIDDTESKEYALHLIGSCDMNANKLIKSLNKKSLGENDKETSEQLKNINYKILEKNISIKVIPFDIGVLESIVRDSLNRYISKKGGRVDFEGLDLIAKGVSMSLMVISTESRPMSKKSFDKKLYQWINTTLGLYLHNLNPYSKHELMIYDKFNKRIDKNMEEIKLENYYNIKNNKVENINRLNQLIKKIKTIQLNTYDRECMMNSNEKLNENDGLSNSLNKAMSNMSKLFEAIEGKVEEEKFLELDDKYKQSLIKELFKLTGERLEEKDFYIGNLKRIKRSSSISRDTYEIIGNKIEKEKYEYINEIEEILFDLVLVDIFIKEMGECSVLPLVLKNTSDVSDKNIKIKIMIPKKIKLILEKNFTYDSNMNSFAERYASSDGIIKRILKVNSDSMVYKDSKQIIRKTDLPRFSNFSHGLIGMDEYNIKDVNLTINDYISQNIYYDNTEYYIIEFDISELFSNEIKALENVILIESLKEDIEIKYEIRSQNSNGLINGVIQIDKFKS